MKLSIAVPTYGMKNASPLFTRLLNSIWDQTEQDFEVVVTDNSEDDIIKNICDYFKTGISYFRNPNKGMAQNTNEAIKKSRGELIKILYMDDFLAHEDSLKTILKHFNGQWLASACTHIELGDNYTQHVHYPRYSENIWSGNNTIGSPSVITIKNEDPLLFDENMTWLLDCDYYHRMYKAYGEPICIRDINVVLGLHQGQATNILSDELKLSEHQYINEKHA